MFHPLIKNKLKDIQALMKKHRVKMANIFGSSVNKECNDSSDVDVLVDVDESIDPVELGGHLWGLTFDLEYLLGRKVDLLTTRSLRNPYFIKQVNETKELIYG